MGKAFASTAFGCPVLNQKKMEKVFVFFHKEKKKKTHFRNDHHQ